MMNKTVQSNDLLKKYGIQLSALDPHTKQVLVEHLQKLKEANEILFKVYQNRSECFQATTGKNICEESIATAFLSSSLACAELELTLQNICKMQEKSRHG